MKTVLSKEYMISGSEETVDRLMAMESTYGQVSKTLCGKENADAGEVLEAVNQLKEEAQKAKKERDAAVMDLLLFFPSPVICKRYNKCISAQEDPFHGCFGPVDCADYEWRGMCPENTEGMEDCGAR